MAGQLNLLNALGGMIKLIPANKNNKGVSLTLPQLDGTLLTNKNMSGSTSINIGGIKIDNSSGGPILTGSNNTSFGIMYGNSINLKVSPFNVVMVNTVAPNNTQYSAGANAGSNAMFYGGNEVGSSTNRLKLVDSNCTNIQSDTFVGSIRSEAAGSSVNNIYDLFYGGYDQSTMNNSTMVTRTGTFINEATVGSITHNSAGAPANTAAMIYGGYYSNICRLINQSNTMVQADTNIGTNRNYISGANVGTNCLFFGGGDGSGTLYFNTNTLIAPTGTLIQAEKNIGVSREGSSGIKFGFFAGFYGGGDANGYVLKFLLLDSNANQIGIESTIITGYSIQYLGSTNI